MARLTTSFSHRIWLKYAMLLQSHESKEFLEQYLSLLSSAFGEKPDSMDEWVQARNYLISAIEGRNASIYSLGLDRDFVQNVTKAIYGKFCFLKRYKDYCVLQDLESELFYAVKSLTTPLEDMLSEYSIITTSIVPYKGMLVCDGLVESANISLGKNYAKSMRDAYWVAKRSGNLIASLN